MAIISNLFPGYLVMLYYWMELPVQWNVKVVPSFLTTEGDGGYVPGEIGEIWVEKNLVGKKVTVYNSGSFSVPIYFDLEVKKKVID